MTQIKLPPPCESVVTIVLDDRQVQFELVELNTWMGEAQKGLNCQSNPDDVPVYAARFAEMLSERIGEKIMPSHAWLIGETAARKIQELRKSFFGGLQ